MFEVSHTKTITGTCGTIMLVFMEGPAVGKGLTKPGPPATSHYEPWCVHFETTTCVLISCP